MVSVPGDRTTLEHNSRMLEGDPNDYELVNELAWIEPVTKLSTFKNKIKATPNLFQFAQLSTNINVYSWPENPNWNSSDRLIGTSVLLIDRLKFDQLNAELGPRKKVNVIMVGFDESQGAEYGEYQKSAYIGGKKNDLIITFGGGSKHKPANWCVVFGWTESELVKKNIETILLTNPINDDILSLLGTEVIKNYEIKDWSKFDYIKISPPSSVYFIFIIIMIISQIIGYIICHKNEIEKDYFNR